MEMVVCEKHTTGECKINDCNHAKPHLILRVQNTFCTEIGYLPFTRGGYYTYNKDGDHTCLFNEKDHVCSNKTKFEIIMKEIIKGNENEH